jgi:pimeloyl-ACP methyl ester carboxylesterase
MPLINNKPLNYRTLGKDTSPPIVFVHHCGGSMESFISLILELQLEDLYSINLFDLEGQGLSPTTPLSKLSIGSFTEDVNGVFEYAQITSSATLIAHGMGCLVAIQFALAHPKKVSRLVLIGLPLCPPSDAQVEDLYERARIVREKGIAAVVDSVASGGTSTRTKVMNPLAYVAVRMSLLGQDSEGYAKACTAFAEANSPDFSAIQADTLLITGSEANASPPETCEWYAKTIGSNASLKVLRDVGHWPIFEDVKGVASLIQEFLS